MALISSKQIISFATKFAAAVHIAKKFNGLQDKWRDKWTHKCNNYGRENREYPNFVHVETLIIDGINYIQFEEM